MAPFFPFKIAVLIPISLPALLYWLHVTTTNPEERTRAWAYSAFQLEGRMCALHSLSVTSTVDPPEGHPYSKSTPTRGKKASILEPTPQSIPEKWIYPSRLRKNGKRLSSHTQCGKNVYVNPHAIITP